MIMKITKIILTIIIIVAFLAESTVQGNLSGLPIAKDDALRPQATKTIPEIIQFEGSLPSYTNNTIIALEQAKGNKAKAAEILVQTKVTVYRRINAILAIAYALGREDIILRLTRANTELPKYTEATIAALEKANYNIAETAGILGKSKSTVYRSIYIILAAAHVLGRADIIQKLARFSTGLPEYTEATVKAFEQANGNKTKAARILNESQQGVYYKINVILVAAHILGRADIILRLTRANTKLPEYTEATIAALEKANYNIAETAGILGKSKSTVYRSIYIILAAAHVLGRADIIQKLARFSTGLPEYTEATIKALEQAKGNIVEAARILGKGQPTVYRRINAILAIAYALGREDIILRLTRANTELPKYTEATIAALEKANYNITEAARILKKSQPVVNREIYAILAAAYTLARADIIQKLARFSTKLPKYTEATIKALEQANGNKTKAARILKKSWNIVYCRIYIILAAAYVSGREDIVLRLTRANTKLPDYTEDTIAALEQAGSNIVEAARILKKSQSTVYSRIYAILPAVYAHNRTDLIQRLYNAFDGKLSFGKSTEMETTEMGTDPNARLRQTGRSPSTWFDFAHHKSLRAGTGIVQNRSVLLTINCAA